MTLLRTALGSSAALILQVVILQAASYRVVDFAGGGKAGDGGPALAARFLSIEGVAAAADGSVYVADPAANRVRRINSAGTIDAYAGAAGLRNPYGLAADKLGNLYIADYGNGRVRKVSADGTATTAASGLKGPRNVALSAVGVLYISDFDAGKVYELRPDGTLAALPINGLGNPAGLAVDPAGVLYIADASSGVVHRYTGGKSEIWVRNLDTPTGLAVGSNGTLFIAGPRLAFTMARTASGQLIVAGPAARDATSDSQGGVLLAAGRQLLRILPSGAAAVVAGSIAPIASEQAKDTLLNGPIGIATDPSGNLYVAEEGASKIRRVTTAGVIQSVGDAVSIQDPVALAVKPSGGLLVAEFEPKRVRGIPLTANGTATTVLAAPNVSQPRGIVADLLGNVFVVDSGSGRLLQISPGGVVSVIAEGFLSRPSAIALDADGALLVADSGHHQIRRYEPWTRNWRTLAGNGTAGDKGDGGPATGAQLNFPVGLVAAPDGSIVIADTFNHRVRRIAPDGTMETLAQAPDLDTPSGVAIGIAGEIYVADLGHNRVVRLEPIPDSAPPDTSTPAPVELQILHAATGLAEGLAPGQLFLISGAPLSAAQADGVQLFLNGRQAAILEIRGDVGYAVVPSSAAGALSVELRSKGATIGTGTATVVSKSPALFRNANTGVVLANDTQGPILSFEPGSIVTVYGTGEGLMPGAVRLVLITPANEADLEILYAGSAPGMLGGLQINARVPTAIPPGLYPLQLWVGDTPARGTVQAAIE